MPVGQNSNNPYLSHRFVAPVFGQPGQPIPLPGGGVLTIPPEGLTQAEYDVLSGIRAGNPVGGPFAQQVIDSLAQYGYLQPGAGEIYGSAGSQPRSHSGPPINQPPPGGGSPPVVVQTQNGPPPPPDSPAPYSGPMPPLTMGTQPSGSPVGYAPSAGGPASPGSPQNEQSRRERTLAQAAASQAANPGSSLSRGWYERHGLDFPSPQSSEPEGEPEPTGTQTPPINPNPMPQPPRWGFGPSAEQKADSVLSSGRYKRPPGPAGTETPPINPRPGSPRSDRRRKPGPGGTQTPPINPNPSGGTQTPPIDPRKRYDSALSRALR